MCAGCFLLWIALAFWAWAIDRALKIIGIYGMLVDFCHQKQNKRKWWLRCATWLERAKGIVSPF